MIWFLLTENVSPLITWALSAGFSCPPRPSPPPLTGTLGPRGRAEHVLTGPTPGKHSWNWANSVGTASFPAQILFSHSRPLVGSEIRNSPGTSRTCLSAYVLPPDRSLCPSHSGLGFEALSVIFSFILETPCPCCLRAGFKFTLFFLTGLPRRLHGEESACQCRRHRFDPWIG